MNLKNQEYVNKFLAVLGVVIIIALIGVITSNIAFNEEVHTVHGMDDTDSSYMELGNREDSTSSWVKRDFDLEGKKVDLKAQTFDGTVYNKTSDELVSWTMTIKIKNDCFINNAWCGIVEIHQYAGSERETVQTLDLRNYKLEDINLDYLHDGDLLIPLKKGDYVIYYPSEKDGEVPILGNEKLTMGMIFYYLDSMDLSEYTIEYQYHRELTQNIGFYIVVAMIVIWLAIYFMSWIAVYSYRRARKEIELKQSGISYMSEIYDKIYIVDLINDELIPAGHDHHSDEEILRGKAVIRKFFDEIINDVSVTYKELVRSFVDMNTLSERLKKDSVVCEYISDTRGWCQARFFAMEREDDQNLKMAVFTIQVIHDEKMEMDKIEQELSREVSEKIANNMLYRNISHEFEESLKKLQEGASRIINETKEEQIKDYAVDILQEETRLSVLTNKILGSLKLSAGLIEVETVRYSSKDLIQGILDQIREPFESNNLELITDISPRIPEALYGDASKLHQIVTYLLMNAGKFTRNGKVSFSVFAKAKDDYVHLLFSVKDAGSGFTEEEVREFARQFQDPKQRTLNLMTRFGMGVSLMDGMLGLMGSQLKLVSEYEKESEFYFEIDQKIADDNPDK